MSLIIATKEVITVMMAAIKWPQNYNGNKLMVNQAHVVAR